MSETPTGRLLTTDEEIREAMAAKEPVMAYQDRMRLRPPLPIIGYNADIVRIEDGTTFLRSATTFYTLSEEDAKRYEASLHR
ncbi:hypothetical protein [Paenibacillus glycanilyticus]|uniref:Uncharacterized protein n=1 Tax=Paenibacillus glycanilyticus TaxID=126569 RepID=A0ABQ6GLM4_9BACL|nr:hypothetical protein [Paenibacillus glycanilyticus]GLX70487.1 hypothetical protein MU1_48330 [Paenibacillus glycanilyticus]